METKRKIIIHVITSDYSKKANFIADLDIMSNFSNENSIHNFYFYEDDKEPPILLNTYYAEVHNYTDEDKLEEKVKLLGQNNEIVYISTPFAVNIDLVDRLRRAVGQVVSKNFDIFVDKSAQKELLAKDKSISVKYLKAKFDELDFGKAEKELGLPFILKPTSVASGLGVAKIKTEEQFKKYLDTFEELGAKIKNEGFSFTDELIAEEFIDGELYALVYFVDKDWKINFWKPVNIKSGMDIWINDFFEAEILVTESQDRSCCNKKLLTYFVERNVELTGIRNTFVKHVFKIAKGWEYKTIEISAWMGLSALPTHFLAYWVNIFSLLFGKVEFNLLSNIALVRLYACKRWILESLNEKLISKIKKLGSFSRFIFKEEYEIWKEYGLAKDGFSMVGTFQLKNESIKKLKKDLEFIEGNYCGILETK